MNSGKSKKQKNMEDSTVRNITRIKKLQVSILGVSLAPHVRSQTLKDL